MYNVIGNVMYFLSNHYKNTTLVPAVDLSIDEYRDFGSTKNK
jgi:hypothetical protein